MISRAASSDRWMAAPTTSLSSTLPLWFVCGLGSIVMVVAGVVSVVGASSGGGGRTVPSHRTTTADPNTRTYFLTWLTPAVRCPDPAADVEAPGPNTERSM